MGLIDFVVNFHNSRTTFVPVDNPAPAPNMGPVPTKAGQIQEPAPTIATIKEPFDGVKSKIQMQNSTHRSWPKYTLIRDFDTDTEGKRYGSYLDLAMYVMIM